MTFRRRIALLAGLSFVAAVIVCSVAGYVTVRRQLIAEIDRDLRTRIDDPQQLGLTVEGTGPPFPGRGPRNRSPQPRRSLPTDVLSQVLRPDGEVTTPPTQATELPQDAADRAIASGGTTRVRDVDIDGEHYLMITAHVDGGVALQVARPLTEVDATLRTLSLQLVVVLVGGAIVAAGVGWWVARRSAKPVEDLTRAAEQVATTLTLDVVGDVEAATTSDDEIGRLARSMSAMLAALRASREQQHRLVLDAGHELRTPLTSLRTNVGLLDHPDLDPATRAAIVADVRSELEELSNLAIELVELASDRQQEEPPAPVAMADLVERVADRARKRTGQTVLVTAEEWSFVGRAGQLDRAVQNLVDNATKWNPPSLPIEVTTTPGEIRVRDHGPGVAEQERERIFERFYRSDTARTTAGSGLGLAIVGQIVAGHGGTVHVERADGGGALFVVRLPFPDEGGVPGPPRYNG